MDAQRSRLCHAARIDLHPLPLESSSFLCEPRGDAWTMTEQPNRLMSAAEMREQLRWPRCDHIETVARTGAGVEKAMARLVELMGA